MKETIEKYLKAIGADADTIAALKAETLPEEFSMDDAISSFNAKRKDLFLNNSEAMKELKKKFNSEQYPAIIKPLQKAIKDSTGLTAEEVTALIADGEKYPDTKELIKAGIAKMKTQGAAGVDEVTAKLHELQKTFDETVNTHTTNIEELKTGFAREKKQGRINSLFSKVVSGLDLIMPVDGANKLLNVDLTNKYQFDIEDDKLVVKNQDGTKVSLNNNFVTAEDLIKLQADEYKILKKSNGGGNGSGNGSGSGEGGGGDKPPEGSMADRVKSGKLTGRAKEMYDKMNKKD